MKDDASDARPVPVPPAVHDLIRQVAPERGAMPSNERRLTIGGKDWVASLVGEIAVGSGELGVAYLDVIHFHPAATGAGEGRRGSPREALIPRGRFEFLYDEELIESFRAARPLPRQTRS